MKLGANVDRNYNHNIDEKIIYIIKKLVFCSKSKLLRELQQYFPTISKTTLDRHLDKMVDQIILQFRKEKNKHIYSFTESAELALKTNLFENVKPKKQNKSIRSNQNLSSVNAKINEIKNNKIIYFLILSQAAAGSRIMQLAGSEFQPKKHNYLEYLNIHHPNLIKQPTTTVEISNLKSKTNDKYNIAIPDPKDPRKLIIGDYKSEMGITEKDILHKTNITIKSAFPNFNPTKSIIQKKFYELQNNYGFEGRIRRNFRSNPEKDIAIEILDDYLRQFILWLEAIFHMVEYRIRYGWIKSQVPNHNSQEFRWYLSTFGKEKTVNVLIKASHSKDYFKKLDDSNKKTKLKNQIKNILNNLNKNIVGFYHAFILCDKYSSELIKLQYHIEFYNNYKVSNLNTKKIKENYLRYTIKIKELLSTNKEMSKILQSIIDEIYYPKFLQNKLNSDQEIQQYIADFMAIK